jgi:hypothetical protein
MHVAALVPVVFVLAADGPSSPLGDAPPPPEATEATKDTAPDEPAADEPAATDSPAEAAGDGEPAADSEAPASSSLVPALDDAGAAAAPSTETATAPAPRLRGFWSGGFHVGALLAPAPTVGLTLGAGVGGSWWSLRVEGSADIANVEEPALTTTPLAVAVAPCAHFRFAGGEAGVIACPTGTAALVPVGGRFTGLGPYVGVGGRIGLEERGDDGGAWRVFLQGESPVVGFRLHADDGEVFTSPSLNVVVGAAVDIPAG